MIQHESGPRPVQNSPELPEPVSQTIDVLLRLREHDAEFRVPLDIVYDPRVVAGGPITLVGLGYGEEAAAAKEAVLKYGERGIPAAVMLFRFFEKGMIPNISPEDARLYLETNLFESVNTATSWLNEQAGKQLNSPVDIVSRSMSTAAHTFFAVRAPERTGDNEQFGPAGINDLSIDTSEAQRIKSFLKGMAKNARHPEQSIRLDHRNLVAGIEIARRFGKDVLLRRFVSKVGMAVTLDSGPRIVDLHNKKSEDFMLWFGEDDPVSPPETARTVIGQALEDNGQPRAELKNFMSLIPGSHPAIYAGGSNGEVQLIAERIHMRRLARQAPPTSA